MNLEQIKYAGDNDGIVLTDIFELEATTDADGNLLYYDPQSGTIFSLDENEQDR